MQEQPKNLFSLQSFRSLKSKPSVMADPNSHVAQESQRESLTERVEDSFSQQMRLNDEARKRRANERLKANQSVLKSYKIKT